MTRRIDAYTKSQIKCVSNLFLIVKVFLFTEKKNFLQKISYYNKTNTV